MMRTGRRGSRSTQTPAGSVKMMKGRKRTVPSTATSNALASRMRTATSGNAMSSIVEPKTLIVSADQSLRKSGWRQRPPVGQPTLRTVALRAGARLGAEQREDERVHLPFGRLRLLEVCDEPVQPPLETSQVVGRQTRVEERRLILVRT